MIRKALKRLSINHNNTTHPLTPVVSTLNEAQVGLTFDMLYFSLLPTEIILAIFSYLDIKALGRVGRVCSLFNELAESPMLWRSLLERKTGKVGVVGIAKSSERRSLRRKRIGSLFVDKNDNPVLTPRDTTSPHAHPAMGDGGTVVDTLPTVCSTFAAVTEEEEMEPLTFSAYIKKTIKQGPFPSGLAEYENWNFKDVCRCCVDYSSITEAMKHIPNDCKCRLIVREGIYRENIKIDSPVEIIGVGDVNKIIVENDKEQNVVIIDTKDSKHPKSLTIIKNLTLYQRASKKIDAERTTPHFCVLLRSGDLLLESNVMTSDSCSTVCIQHNKGTAVIRGNNITGKSAGISIFKCRPDLTIDSNDIHDTFCSGIEVRPGTNPLIVRNKIHHTNSAGIFIFSNATPVGGVRLQTQGTVVKNDIFENKLSGIDISQGACPVIRKNKISHCKELGIYIHEGGKGIIEKNDIHNNAKCNIYLEHSGTPAIRLNKIHSSTIGFSSVGENALGELTSNEIYNHESEGIGILHQANPLVRNNKIHDNKKAGIVVCNEGKGTYEGNYIYNNAGGGFHIQQRHSPTLKDNIIDNNAQDEDIQSCIDKEECTFTVTGYTFRPQSWYYCDTCAPLKDLGCCEACAKVCHVGHQLSEKKYSLFFCDCAAEWDCKILKCGHAHKRVVNKQVA